MDQCMDNILRQAVDYHLLSGPSSPLAVFSQSWVIDLDTAKLALIAGEEAAKERREILRKTRNDLKKGLEILRHNQSTLITML